MRGFEKVSNVQWTIDSFDTHVKYEDIKLPARATRTSAGHDIFSTEDCVLEPNQEVTMPLGWKVYMQPNEMFLIVPRSGMGFKYYSRLANTIGVIDSDYYNNKKNEGECWIKLRNEGTKTLHIEKGDGIAQGIFIEYLLSDGDSLDEGDVREGGFGHTDNSG